MTVIRVPLSWLNDFVEIHDLDPIELAERLTLAGLEVEHIRWVGLNPSPHHHVPPERMDEADGLPWERDKIFVGEIIRTERHPDADRLLLATVEYGGEKPMTIITGAPNLRPGDMMIKIAFATIGARLVDPYADSYKTMVLKAGKIRGIQSEGMACSEKELGISEEHEGIILLPVNAPVGMPLADYIGDAVLEMDLTPNLARDLNILGVAREVAALYDRPLKRSQMELASLAGIVRPEEMPRPQPPADPFVQIVIEDPDLCPRYTATLIRDVEIGPSPGWVKDRLRKAGVRPISNIVDATNYVMLEWGQPTHAFDYDLLVERARRAAGSGERGAESVASSSGRSPTEPVLPTIIMRRAKPGEKMTTLDGNERQLTTDMLMITDTLGPIAVGGVMGGLETEVNERTRNVLLEAAAFDFINNRRTSQSLRLPSEATARFSKGISPELPVPAGQRCARMMADLAAGTVVEGVEDCYPLPQGSVQVEISPAEVRRVLGMDVPAAQIRDILQRLEFMVEAVESAPAPEGAGTAPLRVTAPWFRLDVSIPADLIEEIARIIGYDQIPTSLMDDALPPQWRNWALEGKEQVRDLLMGAGLQDSISYALIGPELNRKLLASQGELAYDALAPRSPTGAPLPIILDPETLVRLENPLTPSADRLRSTLLGSMLNALAANLRTTGRVALFEIGKVYWPLPGELLPAEPEHVAIALAGPREAGAWLNRDDTPMDFFDLKGVVEELLERLGLLGDARFEPAIHPLFGPKAAQVLLKGRPFGVLGELHPAVRRAFDLPDQRAAVAELQLTPLAAAVSTRRPMQPLSSFPAVKEDLALLVDESVTAEQVEQAIRQAGGSLLRQVTLFDVYRGKQVPAGKKSLAYALLFQADDKTLKDADVEKVRRRIMARLGQTVGAELRA
ncbi:MAG TPA: phenylalanine--tRNA ligase subunit beta [Anaerolineae bacterium]|nr:phenylalanine--tRNA ligase subunit beta [Anaerolineae bacterium]